MKILFLGDITGEAGRQAVEKVLPGLKKQHQPDVVIANVENIAHGVGITSKTLNQIKEAGIDYFTSGNHAFNKEKETEVWKRDDLIRPLNFPEDSRLPGRGFLEMRMGGEKIWLVNLQGLIFMPEYLRSPFEVMDEFLKDHRDEIIMVDFHAEATSEKVAFGQEYDGKVILVVGTHTHVQTADERIFPGGTAYITDVGMCGSFDGVIGVEKERVLRHFRTAMPLKTEPADFPAQINGVMVELDFVKKRAKRIERIFKIIER
jgi:hypothetical protein